MGLYWFCVLELDDEVGVAVSESGDLGFSKWLENIQGKPGLWLLFVYYITSKISCLSLERRFDSLVSRIRNIQFYHSK